MKDPSNPVCRTISRLHLSPIRCSTALMLRQAGLSGSWAMAVTFVFLANRVVPDAQQSAFLRRVGQWLFGVPR